MKPAINNKTYGFSLAEVLLTLAIVGVIAALTVPTITFNSQKGSFVSGLKDSFSQMHQTINVLISENGDDMRDVLSSAGITGANNVNIATNSNKFMDLLSTKISMTKKCYAGTNAGVCWHAGTSWTKLSTSGESRDVEHARFIAANGHLYVIYLNSPTCSTNEYSSDEEADINSGFFEVDVNGFTPPNKMGRDIFNYHITKYGLVPVGAKGSMEYDSNFATGTRCNPSVSSAGAGCAGRIFFEGDMNY